MKFHVEGWNNKKATIFGKGEYTGEVRYLDNDTGICVYNMYLVDSTTEGETIEDEKYFKA